MIPMVRVRSLTVLLAAAVVFAGYGRAALSPSHWVFAASTHPVPAPRPHLLIPQTLTSGDKDGFGTAYTYDAAGWPKRSRVWFTLLRGEISEVYYPTFDDSVVNRLRFLVGDGHFLVDEDTGMAVKVRLLNSQALAYSITETDSAHGYALYKTVIADPSRDAIVMQVRYRALKPAAAHYQLYLNLEPTLSNSSLGNNMILDGSRVVAWDKSGAMALEAGAHVTQATVGYRGWNDAVTQLKAKGKIVYDYTEALNGRVAGTLDVSPGSKPFTVVLGFGAKQATAVSTADAALHASFAATERAYIAGWKRYCSHLDRLDGHTTAEYYASVMTIKAAEDKTYEGAIVASPTHPFGNTTLDDGTDHGYILVWPRDLYHASMGLLAAGDEQTAREALDFLALHRNPDGSEPQNMHVDGTPFYTGVQMDEAADAVLLAWRLDARDLYRKLVQPAASFIAHNGPSTQQERWEEASGYSPATIAAEIAALVVASAMAHQANDSKSADSFLQTADSWEKQIESWTYTTTGPLGHHQYYVRITNGHPNAAVKITLANGGGIIDQRKLVDPSFLELVRLGVRSAHDPHIRSTLPAIDSVLRVNTPKGPDWHRYNNDGYGDPAVVGGPGIGHLWPVFDGERGMYDVEAGNLPAARRLLRTMERLAGPTGLIPEQVLEKTGAATTSANPLIWAQGEYVVLLRSIVDGKPFDQPSVVAARYVHTS